MARKENKSHAQDTIVIAEAQAVTCCATKLTNGQMDKWDSDYSIIILRLIPLHNTPTLSYMPGSQNKKLADLATINILTTKVSVVKKPYNITEFTKTY